MACGVPPVATNVGGVPELITRTSTDPRSSRRHLGAIGRVSALLCDPGLHEKMAHMAADRRHALLLGSHHSAIRKILRGGLRLMDSQAIVHQLRYSAWASERSLQSAAAVEQEELHRDLGNSFGGVYGTLVHIYQADAIWWDR